jgi:hypothetical protein
VKTADLLAATPTMTTPKSFTALRTMSRWPFVTGSNLPG